MKNKVEVWINGKELWDYSMGSTGKIAGYVHKFVMDKLWIYKNIEDNYQVLRSVFLSNPDYFIIRRYD